MPAAKKTAPAKRKTAAKKGGAKRSSRSAPRPVYKRPDGHPYGRRGLERAEEVRVFGELYVTHRKDRWAGEPFILEEWQWERIFLPIYGTLNRQQRRKYRFALIGLPRWQGKSEGTALMVMHHLFVERIHGGEAYVVAASEKQAGIVFETVKRMIKAVPELADACDIYKKEIWVKETGCVFRALPHDADTAQGFHPSLCIIDEAHVHKNMNLINAMVSGSVGREEPLIVIITTAASKRTGTLADVLKLWRGNPNAYVYWQGAKDGEDPHDPAVWRRANPASWITDEMLRIQYESLPLWEFERYHLNRPPQGDGGIQAFSTSLLEKNSGLPEIDAALPVVVGVDAAPERDRCAVMVAQRKEDGSVHWRKYLWEPGRQMEFGDFTAIEDTVRRLCGELYVLRIVCDPAFLYLMLGKLKAEGYPVEVMRQDNVSMCNVASMLYKLFTGGMIRTGGDPDIEADALNCAVLERPPYGWRIGKLDDDEHIDTIIAAGMATFVVEAEFGDMYAGPPVIVG